MGNGPENSARFVHHAAFYSDRPRGEERVKISEPRVQHLIPDFTLYHTLEQAINVPYSWIESEEFCAFNEGSQARNKSFVSFLIINIALNAARFRFNKLFSKLNG